MLNDVCCNVRFYAIGDDFNFAHKISDFFQYMQIFLIFFSEERVFERNGIQTIRYNAKNQTSYWSFFKDLRQYK